MLNNVLHQDCQYNVLWKDEEFYYHHILNRLFLSEFYNQEHKFQLDDIFLSRLNKNIFYKLNIKLDEYENHNFQSVILLKFLHTLMLIDQDNNLDYILNNYLHLKVNDNFARFLIRMFPLCWCRSWKGHKLNILTLCHISNIHQNMLSLLDWVSRKGGILWFSFIIVKRFLISI